MTDFVLMVSLRGFSNTETLCSEYKYYCEECRSKQEAHKRLVYGLSTDSTGELCNFVILGYFSSITCLLSDQSKKHI